MSDTNYVQSLDSRTDLVRRYGKRLPTIHAVQQLGTNDGPSEEPKALPLKWLTDEPVWVGQWPMTSEKLEALEKLVQEQLDAGHIEESTSPWNSPIFVIKKKSGKWRMRNDLRAINKGFSVVLEAVLELALVVQIYNRIADSPGFVISTSIPKIT
ncbi:Pol polyprotein [Cricetulus griseus]|nr:Pol polyprotein [Cricetulus griseus]